MTFQEIKEKRRRREEIIRKYYPTLSGREIEERFSIPRSRVAAIAKAVGVSHTPEATERIYSERNAKLLAACRAASTGERRRLAWKRTHHLEELRHLSGEPLQTRFRFATLSRRVYHARWHLIHRHGYIPNSTDPYTLYYDEQTSRCLNTNFHPRHREQHFTITYGFHFLPLPKEAEEDTETEQQKQKL